ncbi:glycoside hydrolase family 2 protein [Capnocytophaga sp.]|uniref:beta-mannosidase n=1 Tax=Capnocytophaga sp. TaxID=44737 RepID=UPI0026DCB2A2|nr:glycoside hydrolase family 2 protein [Capnocytophaga sp.]MDO5104357.1 glycoside hydrolase family 2 protein [Capnocytophaga sp.]
MIRFILVLTLMTLTNNIFAQNNTKTISMNSGWEFSQADQNQWRTAEIPGSVQTDLLKHNLLPDPFFGTNEKKIQWVEDLDWEYRKTFTLTPNDLQYDVITLQFEGLDTHAEIFLNGNPISRTQNMFLAYDIAVKPFLKVGENTLLVRFRSPITHLMPKRAAAGFEYPAGNDHRNEKLSVYSRKAPYHFGWDWGIRIVQMGIWRNVWLDFQNTARITDCFAEQLSVTQQKAALQNHVTLICEKPIQALLKIDYSHNGKTISVSENVSLQKGENQVCVPIEIENPQLWQPVGWGKPHLYDVVVRLQTDSELIGQKQFKTGLRDAKLIREKTQNGESFYFQINGKPLFAKGANYIPGDILTTRQNKAYYDQLFENIRAANMNMIRVWGGGIYENDYFYELANQNGILVWQDFMFACTPYPHDADFLENVKNEAIYNVKRLRNHPCVVLWCGNNEVEESIKYWGFEKQVPASVYEGFKTGYDLTFRKLLPEIVTEFDPQKPYLHGSPDVANWGRPASLAYGDAHYWGVWYGREPFEILNTRISRFMSEFGFQSFPEMKTIRTFAHETDFDIASEVMQTHQKSSTGNDAIKEYMERYYHTPRNFSDFVYVNLVMQGEGMKKGMLAHRRNRPFCMGTLYWQLNDSWPVVSWASIDYYNNWKALHYKTREAFAPIAVDMYENPKNRKTEFYVYSDVLEEKQAILTVELIDFNGKIRKQSKKEITINPNESKLVKSLYTFMYISNKNKQKRFAKVTLSDREGKTLAADHFFFNWAKELQLPQTEIETTVHHSDGKYVLKLKSNRLAKNVFVEIPVQGAKFSDNFFDLLPNEEKTIEISSPELKTSNPTPFSVKHLRQTY